MADDLIQQAAANAPAVTAGGAVGATGIVAALKFFRLFASPQDVELVRAEMEKRMAELRAEMAEKYVTHEAMRPFMEKLDYIQHRIDQLADRK